MRMPNSMLLDTMPSWYEMNSFSFLLAKRPKSVPMMWRGQINVDDDDDDDDEEEKMDVEEEMKEEG
jgi:hypothetical protein